MKIRILQNTKLPVTNSLINVLLVTTTASYSSTQIWAGTEKTLKHLTDKIRASEDVRNTWDEPIFQILCHIPSRNETYVYTVEEAKATLLS